MAQDNQDAVQQSGRGLVVVLGTGRSGTSVAAKVMQAMGLRLDASLNRPNEMNPDGFFEDAEIVEINKALLDVLSLAPAHVPPHDFSAIAKAAQILPRLRSHLEKRLDEGDGLWGVKDPRVSVLLPLYRRVFGMIGVTPRYVYCARDGAATVESLLQATSRSREWAEQFYLTRTLSAMRDCGGNMYVLQYEKLLADPVTQIRDLGAYLWPDGAPNTLSEADLSALVTARFNRSGARAQPLQNPLAQRIDQLVSGLEGASFDHDYVMAELREIGQIHEGYLGWLRAIAAHGGRDRGEAQELKVQIKDLRAELSRTQKDAANAAAEACNEAKDLRSELASAREEKAAAANEADALRKELQSQTDALAQAEAARDDQRAANQALMPQLAALQGQRTQLSDEVSTALQIARQRLAQIDALNASLARAEAKAERMQTQLKAQSEKAEALQTSLREQIAQHNQSNQQLTKIRKKAERDLADLEHRLTVRFHAENQLIVQSRRHQLGSALVDAVRRPGLNTLALPVRVWRALRGAPTRGPK